MFIKRSAFIWGAEKRLFGVGATMDINTGRLKSWLCCRPYAIIFEQKKVPFHSVYCAAGESKVPFVGVHFGLWMIDLILYYTCRDIIIYMVHLAIVSFGKGEKSLWYLFRSRSVDRQSTTICIWINVIMYFLYTVGCLVHTGKPGEVGASLVPVW